MVQSLREKAGLTGKQKSKGNDDQYIEFVAKEIAKHRKLTPEQHASLAQEHPQLHAVAESVRQLFGFTGDTPAERMANMMAKLHGAVEHQKEKFGAVREEGVPAGLEPQKVGVSVRRGMSLTERARVPRIPEAKIPLVPEPAMKMVGGEREVGQIEQIIIDDVTINVPIGREVRFVTRRKLNNIM